MKKIVALVLCLVMIPCFAMKHDKKMKYDKKQLHIRSVQAKELNAAVNAAKLCVDLQRTGGYGSVINRSDCEEMIKIYRDLALRNQNNS